MFIFLGLYQILRACLKSAQSTFVRPALEADLSDFSNSLLEKSPLYQAQVRSAFSPKLKQKISSIKLYVSSMSCCFAIAVPSHLKPSPPLRILKSPHAFLLL